MYGQSRTYIIHQSSYPALTDKEDVALHPRSEVGGSAMR